MVSCKRIKQIKEENASDKNADSIMDVTGQMLVGLSVIDPIPQMLFGLFQTLISPDKDIP